MNYLSLIPYVVALISLAGFLYTVTLSRSIGGKHERHINLLESEKQQKRAGLFDIESNISELIKNTFNKKWGNEVLSGFISVGMPTELLQVAWGRPSDIRGIEAHEGKYQFWFYEPVEGKSGTTYNTKVKIKDNKIVEWFNS